MLTNQDFNKTIDNYNYNINDIIGQGSFSSVYKGKSIITGEKVAIKVINLSGLTADTYQKLQYELSILKNLPPHRNIVKMYKLLQTVNNVYIVTERC
jgi:serine/threonine protein kinase